MSVKLIIGIRLQRQQNRKLKQHQLETDNIKEDQSNVSSFPSLETDGLTNETGSKVPHLPITKREPFQQEN